MRGAVLVSGVGKGFGRSLAKHLIHDFHIIGVSRSVESLESLRVELLATDQSFDLILSDVSNFEDTEQKIQSLLNSSPFKLVGLINNAGVRCRKPIGELSMSEIMDISAVNLFGAINLTKVVLPYLVKSGFGRVINVSSILAAKALPDLSAYAISKAGLDAFTRSMAVELAPQNIAVNSILPGFSKTSYHEKFIEDKDLLDMTLKRIPMGHWGEEDEIVGLCRFLLSNEARYITGASIPIDGGWLA